jgi:hypothetical protein
MLAACAKHPGGSSIGSLSRSIKNLFAVRRQDRRHRYPGTAAQAEPGKIEWNRQPARHSGSTSGSTGVPQFLVRTLPG